MRLSTLLAPGRIKCGLASATKDEALREMVELVAAGDTNLSPADLLAALLEREKQGPFSMGKGIAFPHARTEKITEFIIAVGTSERGVDFTAPDGRPIHIVLLFVVPKKHSNLYLHTLAAFLSFFQVEEHVRRVLAAQTGQEVVAVVDALGPRPAGAAGDRVPFRPVVPVRLDTPLAQIIERVRISGLDAVPVVDAAGDLLGEVRTVSLVRATSDPSVKIQLPLSGFPDLLARNGIPSVDETAGREDARKTLASTGASYAYVLRGRRLVGRLSARDLLP